MDCGSQRFKEIIENNKENLKYLKQLETTYTAAKQGQMQKFKALLLNAIGLPFKDTLENMLGDSVSFEALVGALQILAIVNPAVLGTVLEKEMQRMEEYFRGELELVFLTYQRLEEGISFLDGKWSELKDFNSFLDTHRLSLNEFYNSDLPRAVTHVNKSKTHLILAENALYNTNVLRDDDTQFMNQLLIARSELSLAKDLLSSDELDPKVVLLSFESWWKDVKGLVGRFSGIGMPSWEEMKEGFAGAGVRLKTFFESLYAAVTSISTALVEIDEIDSETKDVWQKVHRDLIKNQTEDSIKLAPVVFEAIWVFITTGIPQAIPAPIPMIGTPVTESNITLWEAQANAYKPFQGVWYNKISEAEHLLSSVTTGATRDALDAYDTIYSPFFDVVIDLYESASAPFWRRLYQLEAIMNNVLSLMLDGKEVATDVMGVLVNLRGQLWGIKTALENVVTYFDEENPVAALRGAMGITTDIKAIFHGFSAIADSMGFDFFSQLLQMGDFAKALTLEAREADTIQQLLGCLRSVEHHTEIKKAAALAIQKIAIAEKIRKNKLQQSFDLMIQEGVKAQEATIAKQEALLETYNR